ncbi:DNA cytosine methyltransferase [Alkaliphilus sp. B6464]|uniref:DNA cytosine methyltransferase n=1 Tax=Alkaliphilus sp. B6464 TaxID=2731219 RepID=UPI001BA759FA|nr:DNA cytosine methyltransferase [Alkaliphilus sp. B6464]QUH21941.1 DNA cytosine methyltransferase [Alkaliphilus sp. B6464]
MKDLKNEVKLGSMFCGMGGFDEGVRRLGFKTIWALDIMPEAVKSFKANHPDANVYCKNVHTIKDFNTLSNQKIDGLVFGPPCQGFSRANSKRTMDDPRNYAYIATLRALEQTNAEFFIFENVVGLLDMNFEDGSSVFKKIKHDYETCGKGYIITYQVIDCATVGVPQVNRLRLIMVGIRNDLNYKYKFLPTTHGEDKLPFITQKDAIWHLKDTDQTGQYYNGAYDWKFLSRRRQKPWEEPAYTIEASARYAKIHPGFGKMKWISENKWHIPDECRRLSVLESKIIQTFSEDYIVCGSLEKQYTQIGNAVPPKLAEFVGMPLVEYFNNRLNIEEKYKEEVDWLIEKIEIQPSNNFYKGLLNWIYSGKDLTERQRRYILV